MDLIYKILFTVGLVLGFAGSAFSVIGFFSTARIYKNWRPTSGKVVQWKKLTRKYFGISWQVELAYEFLEKEYRTSLYMMHDDFPEGFYVGQEVPVLVDPGHPLRVTTLDKNGPLPLRWKSVAGLFFSVIAVVAVWML